MVCMTASVTVVKRQKIIHFLLVYGVFADRLRSSIGANQTRDKII